MRTARHSTSALKLVQQSDWAPRESHARHVHGGRSLSRRRANRKKRILLIELGAAQPRFANGASAPQEQNRPLVNGARRHVGLACANGARQFIHPNRRRRVSISSPLLTCAFTTQRRTNATSAHVISRIAMMCSS
jgi:hypothetical protein